MTHCTHVIITRKCLAFECNGLQPLISSNKNVFVGNLTTLVVTQDTQC